MTLPAVNPANAFSGGLALQDGQLLKSIMDELFSVETGITAFATGGQAGARTLSNAKNNVTTVATAADSVKLPPAQLGRSIFVRNSAGANSMQVFGSGTDTINGVATATGVAQAAGKGATYTCISYVPGGASLWVSELGA